MIAKLSALIQKIPLGVRYIIRDAIEGALAAVVALNLAIPGSLVEAKAEGLTVVVAVAGAGIAVLRREALPAIWAWLQGQLTQPPTKPDGSPTT